MDPLKKEEERHNNGPIQQVSGRVASMDEAKAAEAALDRMLSDWVAQIKNNSETEEAYERRFNESR
jgi:hypothetical protein